MLGLNKCPNCGLPLLLVDSQGKQLFRCHVEQDPSRDDGARHYHALRSKMTGITTPPIDYEMKHSDLSGPHRPVLRWLVLGMFVGYALTTVATWYVLN